MALGPEDDSRTPGSRIVIVGASGSGKSTLARALGVRMDVEVIDLDRIHWLDKVGVAREENDAKRMVSAHAANSSWIIEGVFGWLAQVALPRATSLIWLDLPWSVCREGLAARGPWPGASAAEHAGFLAWAEDYWRRDTPSSFKGHLAQFAAFGGPKWRLRSRAEAADWLANTP